MFFFFGGSSVPAVPAPPASTSGGGGGLSIRPHFVTLYPASGAGNRRRYGPTGTLVRGLMEPLSADAAYRAFGPETQAAFRLWCDTDDAALCTVGSRLVWGGLYYLVVDTPLVYTMDSASDHAQVPLARQQLQGVSAAP